MSANLLDGATVTRGTKDADGYWVLSQNDGTDKKDSPMWRIDGQPTLTENQTMHLACSVMPDDDLSTNAINMGIEYKDAAGNANWVGTYAGKNAKAGVWTRLEMECVVPSGMRVDWGLLSNAYSRSSGAKVTGVTISYGSPVCLASSAHTPYATQDHLRSEYATKAALKVTSDAVTAEVEERGKLAGKVGTLESTSGTHTSKLEQLAASIKSLVKGESTYTGPDGKSATSGIYSLVTQTRDSVTALFGQYTKTADMQSQIATAKSQATAAANSATDSKLSSYTKTADLASTQAVKDAKKAGTDAQAAASAAQSTADTAKADAATAKTNAASAVSTANNAKSTADSASTSASKAVTTANTASSNASSAVSTANAAKTSAASAVSTANSASSTASSAKSTADSLATLIRADSTGITVGKSADGGTTYPQGRTRQSSDAFEVLDAKGDAISSFSGDEVSLARGTTFLRTMVERGTTGTPAPQWSLLTSLLSCPIYIGKRDEAVGYDGDVTPEQLAAYIAFSAVGTNAGRIVMHAVGGAELDGRALLTEPTVLFDNESQALNTSIPLSDSAGNYKRLKIFYKSDDSDYCSVEVYNPNGKTVALQIARPAYAYATGAAPVMYVKSKIVKINGATIDTVQVNTYGGGSNYLRMQKNLSGGYDASDKVGIIRVEGYKW